MKLPKDHLLADVKLEDLTGTLCEWSWLLSDEWSTVLVSAVGDVFLINRASAIARLDTGTAVLEPAANTREEFEAALADPGTSCQCRGTYPTHG